MTRFVVEVSNAKRNGPAYVHPGALMNGGVCVTATGILVLHPSTDADATRVQLTAQQFRDYSYDLEGKSAGKFGCAKDVALHAVNPDTGERVPLSFAEARELVEQNLNDDEAALADQAKQEAEIQKLADDRDAEEREADAVDAAQAVNAS